MDPLKKLMRQRKDQLLHDPGSIVGELEAYLAENGIYYGIDQTKLKSDIKGHSELCGKFLELYRKAVYDGERISLLEYAYAAGCDKDELTRIIINAFDERPLREHLWEYGDLLYRMKNFRFLPDYLRIIADTGIGQDRQMVVLLVGKSRSSEALPILKELTKDETVCGHAVEALCNYQGEDITEIMQRFSDHETKWIRDTAKKYLTK